MKQHWQFHFYPKLGANNSYNLELCRIKQSLFDHISDIVYFRNIQEANATAIFDQPRRAAMSENKIQSELDRNGALEEAGTTGCLGSIPNLC